MNTLQCSLGRVSGRSDADEAGVCCLPAGDHSSLGDAVREGAKEVMSELNHANPGGAGELPS